MNYAATLTRQDQERDIKARELYPAFEEASWRLSLRGILRPGVNAYGAQAVDEGGYSLTEVGKERLASLDTSEALLIQSNSLIQTFIQFHERYGLGFSQRAHVAVRCRDACAWLASCVMCGAAAEAVLLAIAAAKIGDEEAVLAEYKAAGGRRRVLNKIAHGAKPYIAEQLKAFTGIISIWRDVASHGTETAISIANSDEALRQLLHFCQWADKEWDTLTAQS